MKIAIPCGNNCTAHSCRPFPTDYASRRLSRLHGHPPIELAESSPHLLSHRLTRRRSHPDSSARCITQNVLISDGCSNRVTKLLAWVSKCRSNLQAAGPIQRGVEPEVGVAVVPACRPQQEASLRVGRISHSRHSRWAQKPCRDALPHT